MTRARPSTGGGFQLGDLVEITTGPHAGTRGEITGVRSLGRAFDVLIRSGARDRTVHSLEALEIVLARPCPYCGRGPCVATARTANGRDLERHAAIHTGAGMPERFGA